MNSIVKIYWYDFNEISCEISTSAMLMKIGSGVKNFTDLKGNILGVVVGMNS